MSGFKLLDDSSAGQGPELALPVARRHADQALGLTIHALPTPEGVGQDPATHTRRGRWQMLLVLLVCAAPVLASYFSYYVLRPEGRRNFGKLIEPQRDLPDLASRNLSGEQSNLKALRGQWLLISVAAAACDDACSAHLYLQRQLRESLGKNKDRVDWVWLIPDESPVPARLLPALKGATLLRIPATGLATWLTPEQGHEMADHLYLVDPLGHWMMRFPASLTLASAGKAKHDLERLLQAAVSWDLAGRQGQQAHGDARKP